MVHIMYISCLQTYIAGIYLVSTNNEDDTKVHPVQLYIIGLCLLYPAYYDGKQLYSQGWEYFNDPWNAVDVVHISIGYLNLFI
jgi:hypothetical protein